MHTHATTDSPNSSHDHGDPFRTYIAIFVTLMVLLFMTIGAYYIPFEKIKTGEGDLGWVNTAVALTIATIKTSLVVLFFMHLRFSTRLTWVVATAGFMFLCIMVLFTFTDYNSRNMSMLSEGQSSIDAQAGTHANGEVLLLEAPNQDNTDGW